MSSTLEAPSTSPLRSTGTCHVGIRVADYDAAIRWYADKLDFRLSTQWEFNGMKFAYMLPAGDDAFEIELLAAPIADPRPVSDDPAVSLAAGGYHHFCLTVESVGDAMAELRKRGVTVIGEPFEIAAIHRKLLYLRDPWGNMIELAEKI